MHNTHAVQLHSSKPQAQRWCPSAQAQAQPRGHGVQADTCQFPQLLDQPPTLPRQEQAKEEYMYKKVRALLAPDTCCTCGLGACRRTPKVAAAGRTQGPNTHCQLP
jgi:hypothetical protein